MSISSGKVLKVSLFLSGRVVVSEVRASGSRASKSEFSRSELFRSESSVRFSVTSFDSGLSEISGSRESKLS